jgi:toxin ParE1/3/4
MPAWTPRALDALVLNIQRYAQQDPVTAFKVFDNVKQRSYVLDDQPEIGKRGRVAGTRELVLTGTPFILVYRGNKSPVDIINVLHSHQDWPIEDN